MLVSQPECSKAENCFESRDCSIGIAVTSPIPLVRCHPNSGRLSHVWPTFALPPKADTEVLPGQIFGQKSQDSFSRVALSEQSKSQSRRAETRSIRGNDCLAWR